MLNLQRFSNRSIRRLLYEIWKKKLVFCPFQIFVFQMNLLLHLILVQLLLGEEVIPKFIPLQLVRPNLDHSGFEIVSETVSRLLSPSMSGKKIAIISVVGPYHSGKSFLLNALIGRTNVFAVGPKTSPETLGLWICRSDILLPRYPETEIWFIDSEGFFGPKISELYDAKIFTLSMRHTY